MAVAGIIKRTSQRLEALIDAANTMEAANMYGNGKRRGTFYNAL